MIFVAVFKWMLVCNWLCKDLAVKWMDWMHHTVSLISYLKDFSEFDCQKSNSPSLCIIMFLYIVLFCKINTNDFSTTVVGFNDLFFFYLVNFLCVSLALWLVLSILFMLVRLASFFNVIFNSWHSKNAFFADEVKNWNLPPPDMIFYSLFLF